MSALSSVRVLLSLLRSPKSAPLVSRLAAGELVDADERLAGNLVQSGLAVAEDGGLRLAPDVLGQALAALDPAAQLEALLATPRIALAGRAPGSVNGLVHAVVTRCVRDGEVLSEAQVNERLSVLVEDVAFFRRHAVDLDILRRKSDGTAYWLSPPSSSWMA